MTPASTDLREFYRKFHGENVRPVEPGSEFYVDILASDPARDPILGLKTSIVWAESESVNLLTGFRGNGKSTELRRLKRLLEDDGCVVFLVDMLDGLLLTKPLEVSDFLLALMAALSRAIEQNTDLHPIREGYWERLRTFLGTEVQLDALKLGGSAATPGDSAKVSAELSFRLKTDPSFKALVQERLRGHVTTLVRQAHQFVAEVVARLREVAVKPDLKVVLLVDSVEQIRGQGQDAERVHQSVVDTFANQAASLALPTLHVVYTVPPFILALAPNVARSYGGRVISWPNVHVRSKDGGTDESGMQVMVRIVERREPNWESRVPREWLHRLASSSGGDIRDYFRLLRECLVGLSTGGKARVDEVLVDRVEQQLRAELLPIAADDARWLARIAAEKQPALDTVGEVPRFARFLDSNLVMNYLNGQPWYDIHPLIAAEVERLGNEPAPR